jgi:hypothetical protein
MRLHFPQGFMLPCDNNCLLLVLSQHHLCIQHANNREAVKEKLAGVKDAQDKTYGSVAKRSDIII